MWYLLEFTLPNGRRTWFWHNEVTSNCHVLAVRDVVEKPKLNVVNAMEVINAAKLDNLKLS